MKKSVIAVAACLALSPFTAACAPAQVAYTNPILYADYSDPDVIRVGKAYYLVASSFHFSPGIPVLKSTDLVHWKIIGHVLPKLTFAPEYDMPGPFQITDATSKPVTGTRYASGVWAPAIRFHDGLFYVYWPTPDEGVFMATAKDPAGPWSKPVAVIAQPGLEDPCPFWDDDGQAWLIHGKVGAGPLILHKMSDDGTKVLDDGKVVAEDKVNLPVLEGPKLYKRNGWYYIFAPIGGVSTGGQAVGRSRSIEGPYEWKTVLEKGESNVQGPHQGGYVETPSGQGWFIHFNSTGAFGRIDYLEPVRWQDDWPVMGDEGHPAMSHAMPDTGTASNDRLQESDDFSSKTLGPQWEWNHNPDDARWSLTQRPGYLRLIAGQADYLVTARNTLTQILQGPNARIEARIDISHMTNGQRAGLVLFGVKPVWIGVVHEGSVSRITFSSAGVETAGPQTTAKTLLLRADVTSDQTARFAYSLDGKTFTPWGEPTALAKFSWWKGSRPGVFTYVKPPSSAGGYIDVDRVTVSHPGN
jgi:beta-xylosidase